jgi:hypothetical protein
MRGARPQRPVHQRQREALRFQWFRGALVQAVPEQSGQYLCPRINSQALFAKRQAERIASNSRTATIAFV